MRPIKFRAWDGKKMVEPGYITPSGWFENFRGLEDGDRSEGPLMQFTGLIDQQGVEIYEGDIVVKDEYIWFCDGEPNYRGTVEWIYSQWQVIPHCVNSKKRGISDGINQGLNDDGVEDGDKSEWIVIGNIHQHPELLQA